VLGRPHGPAEPVGISPGRVRSCEHTKLPPAAGRGPARDDPHRPRTVRGAGGISGVGGCEREAALLVPGYTGSKEDFLAIAGLLAGRGRPVVAIDMRGQFETPGPDEPEGYSPAALGADIAALVEATGARHLLGHSYGRLRHRCSGAARPLDPSARPQNLDSYQGQGPDSAIPRTRQP
jgi:pimeloyl-ACP methyl ester carboxylesterase